MMETERKHVIPVFTIPADSDESNAVPTGGMVFGSLQLPAEMTGASFNLQVSNDGETWSHATKLVGGVITDLPAITFAASKLCPLYAEVFAAKYARIKSVATEAAVRVFQSHAKG